MFVFFETSYEVIWGQQKAKIMCIPRCPFALVTTVRWSEGWRSHDYAR